MPHKKIILLASSIFILGCSEISSRPTRIDSYFHAGIREDTVIIAIPVITQKKSNGTVRYLTEIRTEVRISNPIPVPIGFITGPRIRW